MSRFLVQPLPLDGLKLIERQQMGDSRGFLSRIFCADELTEAGWLSPIAQINHTLTTKRGTVRGMHYQIPPHSEMKLVTCIVGEVLDVAVDLRADSRTFLHWHCEHLSAANNKALLIPEGFAHGFQSLSENVHLLYCHSEAYAQDAEAGLNPLDDKLNIDWPIEINEISDRDKNHPMLNDQFEGIVL